MTGTGMFARGRSALCNVGNETQTSTLRLDAKAMGRAHGLDTDAVERLGIVVTEMARNIERHAGMGQIILRTVGEYATGCIEILALDKGRGVADLSLAMRDQGSTSGEARRHEGPVDLRQLCDLFDIYSQPGHGTAAVAQIGVQTVADVGVVCVPVHGEEECGDAWAVEAGPGRLAAMLVDGLGPGPDAAAAAEAAMAVFRDRAAAAPESLLRAMHTALHDTRGAALSFTVIDQTQRTTRFCGVGNVDGRVVTVTESRQLSPQNGIVGHAMPRPHAVEVPWPIHGRLVMHSDGVSSRWRADKYPGLLVRHPALLAGVLFRDCARARDDATVLVLRDALPATAA